MAWSQQESVSPLLLPLATLAVGVDLPLSFCADTLSLPLTISAALTRVSQSDDAPTSRDPELERFWLDESSAGDAATGTKVKN